MLAKGKTDKATAWVYVRDDRPFGGNDPPAAIFHYSRGRGGEHPERHLSQFTGLLQADAYAGFNRLFDPERQPAPATLALCWAHSRRKFFELADVGKKGKGKKQNLISPMALDAVKRIDALFEIEREINGCDAAQRLQVRQEKSKPLMVDLEHWMRDERAKLSRHAEVAKAFDSHERHLVKSHHYMCFPFPASDVRDKLLGKYGKGRINSHPVAKTSLGEPLSLLHEAQLEETRPHYMTAFCSQSNARFVTLTSGKADQALRIST